MHSAADVTIISYKPLSGLNFLGIQDIYIPSSLALWDLYAIKLAITLS